MEMVEISRFLEIAGTMTATGLSMLLNLAFIRGWITTPAMDKRVSDRVGERLTRIEEMFKDTVTFLERQTDKTVAIIERNARSCGIPTPEEGQGQ